MINSLSGATGFQPQFAAPMLIREAHRRHSAKASIAWLQKVLGTEQAEGIAVETFWGLRPTEPTTLIDNVQLMPFNSLPVSRQKEALSKTYWNPSPAVATPTFLWDAPTAALVRPAVIRPYLRDADSNPQPNNTADYRALFTDARLCLATCGRRAIVPGPGWFQYIDPDLEAAVLGSSSNLSHHELMPFSVESTGPVDTDRAIVLLDQFIVLDSGQKIKARIAMQRLSQAYLRRSPADKALELAIALEAMLVDSPGEHTFKIGLRAALLTSSNLDARRRNRAIIQAMYKVRSSLMHSGQASDICRVSGYGDMQTAQVITEASAITAGVIEKIVGFGATPDWSAIELSSPAYTTQQQEDEH
jgi:hypothetical protein